MSMRCPVCYFKTSQVLETRPKLAGLQVKRRRECPKCLSRWVTVEEIEYVLKKTLDAEVGSIGS